MGTQGHKSYCVTLIISDMRRAISSSRPSATCWYRIAMAGVVCPSRPISSAILAPLLSSHNCAGVPQVVEAKIIAPSGLACPLPVLLEGPAATDLPP